MISQADVAELNGPLRDTDSDTERVHISRWSSHEGFRPAEDILVREEPLEIRIQGQRVAVTMRTPGCDPELVCGFLFGEGLIRRREDILEVAYCRHAPSDSQNNVVQAFLSPSVEVDFNTLTRHVYASSSCGICGKASIDAIHQHFPPLDLRVRVRPDVLLALPERLQSDQKAFHQTGGLHAAGLFNLEGDLIAVREDVGRHNAVDKVIGFALLVGQLPLEHHIMLVSGRASFEIMQKALAARIPIVAAISAPSALAVQFARDSGQVLAGFVRGRSMNVYAGAEQVRRE
jgi:FdhD protein